MSSPRGGKPPESFCPPSSCLLHKGRSGPDYRADLLAFRDLAEPGKVEVFCKRSTMGASYLSRYRQSCDESFGQTSMRLLLLSSDLYESALRTRTWTTHNVIAALFKVT